MLPVAALLAVVLATRKLRKLKGKVAVTARAGTGPPVAIANTIRLKQPKR